VLTERDSHQSGSERGFAAASLEFDSRPGAVRDRVAAALHCWFTVIQEEIEAACNLGQFQSDLDSSQLAFELHTSVQEANWGFQMFRKPEWFVRARRSTRTTLARSAAGKSASNS
jgi:hypothetical protein